ncbi:MAG: PrsW family intramembrane metalloprotease [Clostridia bacterium]|nr:PrsW family intramembrane metalloprotease [Clostridia bacterium]
MENLMYILFICITIPLVLMTFLLESSSRRSVIFFITGICAAVFAAEVNGILLRLIPLDIFNFTTRVTPVTEEIIKALPVLFYAKVISTKREALITVSLSVGIGFAVMENTYELVQHVGTASLMWSVMRGLGTGIMHGMGTFLVGAGFTFANKNKKIFATVTFALLSLSITYHAVFNMLVQSKLRYVGAALPVITYVPFVLWLNYNRRKRSAKK